MAAYYTLGEIAFLLPLSRQAAWECDEAIRSSLARFAEADASATSSDGPELPVLVRHADVHRAEQAVAERTERTDRERALATVRASGVELRELADAVGTSHVTVQTRTRQSFTEVLDELGGPGDSPDAPDLPTLCIKGDGQPRARVRAVYRKIRGGRKLEQRGRQLSVCYQCAEGGPEAWRLETEPSQEPVLLTARRSERGS